MRKYVDEQIRKEVRKSVNKSNAKETNPLPFPPRHLSAQPACESSLPGDPLEMPKKLK